MIKGLQGSNGVQVSGVYSTGVPSLHNPNDSFNGVLRINSNDIQYYTNGSWINLPVSYAMVQLDQETLDVISWAKTQRTMAMNRLTLAQHNPALMQALEKLKKAEDNFELLAKFVENDIDKKELLDGS